MDSTTRAKRQRSEPSNEDDVVVGRIKGPWGLRGDLKVEALTDFSARFSQGSLLYLDGQPVRVQRSREVKGDFVAKLDVVDDRTQAEALRGRLLTVPQHELNPLPKGSYYHFQVVGMAVWSESGEYLGEVKEILPTRGANDVYLVGEGRSELLVPAVDEVVLEVDPQENKMTVRLPEGLV